MNDYDKINKYEKQTHSIEKNHTTDKFQQHKKIIIKNGNEQHTQKRTINQIPNLKCKKGIPDIQKKPHI